MSVVRNSQAFYVESLQTGLSDFWKKIYAGFIQDIAKDWHRRVKLRSVSSTSDVHIIGIELLNERLSGSESRLASLRSRYRIFHTEISQAVTKDAKFELILEFCKYLGNHSPRADKRALSRWLDESAVTERWQSRIKDQEFFAAFIMGRIAAVFDLLAFSDERPDMREMWSELKIESTLTPWIRYAFEAKVQLAAFKSLSSGLVSIHDEDAHLLSSELLRYTYRFSLDNKQQSELQIEALNLLAVADLNKAIALIQTRLAREDEADQIFFREAICDIICLHYLNKPAIFDLTRTLIGDPSPTVRQSVVKTLTICDDEDRVMAMVQRLAADDSDAVYCYLVTQIPFILTSQYCLAFLLYEFSKPHSYVRLRALGQALVHWSTLFYGTQEEQQEALDKIYSVLVELATTHSQPNVQYLALDIREKIWAKMESNLDSLFTPLLDATSKARVALTPEQQAAIESDQGKRWLAANIGHRFSIQLHKRYVQRTDQFGFRMWRFLYELLHPATDKRQHHSHVVARRYKSRHIVPSAILAEVSQTTVPGEPLHMAKEGHWRPFLPLVDQLLSALSNGITGRETVLHHIAGKTIIKPPAGIKNLYARTVLSVRFSHYARLRNVAYSDEAPDAYVRALEKLGFCITCNGHPLKENEQSVPVTPAVSRFFDLGVPVVVVQFYQDFQRYFVSVYQNTIQHILLFSLAMVALFWGNHAVVSQRIKRDRAKIPMTIGGWGTRGKSGTERLKAALVNSVGLSTVSKTTGCEAMFLFATRYGALKEMFLFRPYDKATIWEQTFVTRMAARLKSDVLCWECMGLTPRYIDILQQQWMRDDMVTITNCFPDHEDLQGPAGVDVPQVIAKFISKNAKAWTTEDNMLAYLEKEAVEINADLSHVNWLEIATIPEDLLARFPYEEHPANIALIANMAEEMQLSRTMAIKEMADRVVPDIGVLQVFPYAEV